MVLCDRPPACPWSPVSGAVSLDSVSLDSVPLDCHGIDSLDRDPWLDLWFADLDQAPPLPRLQGLLSPDEQQRVDRYRTQPLKHRFAASRALLRGILGHYLGLDPAVLAFDYGPQGKPSLQPCQRSTPRVAPPLRTSPWLTPALDLNLDVNLDFNLSHCQGFALYGVSSQPLGVDLEVVRPLSNPVELAQRFFAAPEVATLAALNPGDQAMGFLRHWVCKEAFVKAIGTGLSHALDQVVVSFNPCPHLAVIPPTAGSWHLQELTPTPATLAAFVTVVPPQTLRYRSPNWDFVP